MYNEDKTQNEELIKKLVNKEGYDDLGWANAGVEFTIDSENRSSPLTEIDCSLYANRGTNRVYIDHEAKQILHVDSSD